MSDISRRDFLKVAFGTVSAAAVSGPLALIWPDEARTRPVAEPWRIDLEDGYLIDREWTGDDWPTYREHWDDDLLSVEEKIEQLLGHAGYDGHEACDGTLITRPRGGWHARALARIEQEFGAVLDDAIDADLMSFDELLWHGPYAAGGYLLEELPPDDHCRLGLRLVEGECPGNDFCAVRFTGDVSELNRALARHGINVLVSPAAG